MPTTSMDNHQLNGNCTENSLRSRSHPPVFTFPLPNDCSQETAVERIGGGQRAEPFVVDWLSGRRGSLASTAGRNREATIGWTQRKDAIRLVRPSTVFL
jgi:hypothetical protein